MQPQLGIWRRFIRSLLGVDRYSLSWGSGRGLLEVLLVVERCGLTQGCGRGLLEIQLGSTDAASTGGSGRGLLEVYQGWTNAASAGDLEEVYQTEPTAFVLNKLNTDAPEVKVTVIVSALPESSDTKIDLIILVVAAGLV